MVKVDSHDFSKKRSEGRHRTKGTPTYKQILLATARVLNEFGPDQVSLARIMSSVGMTNGGFYLYFESKEDLMLSALDHMVSQSEKRFHFFAKGVSPKEALNGYSAFYLSMEHVRDFGAGCYYPSLSRDIGRMSPIARARVWSGITKIKDSVAALLKNNGMPPNLVIPAASSIFAEMVGAVTLARASISSSEAQEILERSHYAIHQRV